jgi:hypothetical protein
MIEKSNGEGLQPATDSLLRPGDFILCSRKSRAAARALLERRKRPNHPPGFTLDLSSESFERCQEIYARFAGRSPRGPVRAGEPYLVIRFPGGFTPTDPANTGRNQNRSESRDLQ